MTPTPTAVIRSRLLAERERGVARAAPDRSPALALDTEIHAGRAPLVRALYRLVNVWLPFVDSCTDARLEGVLQYRRLNGAAAEVQFGATLAQAFNHATRHRGQISAALTAMASRCPRWIGSTPCRR